MTPTTRPLLPRYKGKPVNSSDLLEATDRANHRFLEVSDLVDSISHQTARALAPNFFDSRRPTRATTHERLGTSLTVTATPESRTVKLKTTSPNWGLPHGLSNTTDQVSRHAQSLFRKIDLSSEQPMRTARHFINMVSVRTLPEDNTASTNSSIGSVSIKVLCLEDEAYDLDLPPYPMGFSCFPIFPPRRGDLVFNVSNDEPVIDGETDEQRQQREQRNTDRAQQRADEEQRQLVSNNIDDAFDMVANQQVFKTPSANVAIAMANLDRLPDTPEYQGVRTNIRVHLIAAMGPTTDLLRRVQTISYTEDTSDQTNRSRASPRLGGHRRSHSPINDRRKEAHRDDHGRDTGHNREQRRGHDQEVDQGRNRDL